MDSGTTFNYIKPNLQSGKRVRVNENRWAKTIHGYSKVQYKQQVRLLKHNLEFFELDELAEFDMMLGSRSLTQMRARIDFSEYKFYYAIPNSRENSISNDTDVQRINYTIDCPKFSDEINELMKRNEDVYETLPFTTTIEAAIRTVNDDPVWVKQYPYPVVDHDFVNREIEHLLKNGIIQKSHSPYNAPIWTVPKKGIDENGKPKRRMVMDFSKLNAHTIKDRYPIPDINLTLQNLGKAKVFSTIDLESGVVPYTGF